MKYVLSIIALVVLSYISYIQISEADQSILVNTIEFNNQVYTECFQGSIIASWSDTQRYRTSTDCWKSKRKLTSDDLFLTVPKYLVDEGRCSISQTEDNHVKPERGGMYATDLACNFKEQGVYAPDYLDQMIEYKIESVWSDNLLGNFVILSFPSDVRTWANADDRIRWYLWHTVLDNGWKVWDNVKTWVRFAHADLSGATTEWHTHVELRRMYDGVWIDVRYVTREKYQKVNSTWSIDIHKKICDKQPSSPLCKDKELLTRLERITEERIPGKNFFPLLIGITNAESSLGLDFARDKAWWVCDGRNNWWGTKYQIHDDNTRTYSRKLGGFLYGQKYSGRFVDQYWCNLYPFESIDEFWITKVNGMRYGYKGCIDHETPIRCISYRYVGNPNVAEESWIRNVAYFVN